MYRICSCFDTHISAKSQHILVISSSHHKELNVLGDLHLGCNAIVSGCEHLFSSVKLEAH